MSLPHHSMGERGAGTRFEAAYLKARLKRLRARSLYDFRTRQNWSLRAMSRVTGLSPATLWRLEHGLSRLTPRSSVRLQDALGLTRTELDALVNGH